MAPTARLSEVLVVIDRLGIFPSTRALVWIFVEGYRECDLKDRRGPKKAHISRLTTLTYSLSPA